MEIRNKRHYKFQTALLASSQFIIQAEGPNDPAIEVRRSQRQLKRKLPFETESEPPVKKKKSKAEKAKEYRDNLKQDPRRYEAYRENEIERCRQYRQRRTEEAVIRDRELSRLRQIEYRKRKKEEGVANLAKTRTRKKTSGLREKWADQQRKHRANLSQEEKDEINRKRREAYARKKHQNPPISTISSSPKPSQQPILFETPSPSQSSSTQSPSSVRSDSSIRQAKSRFRQRFKASLPGDKTIRAEVLSDGINHELKLLSPNSKKIVQDKLGIISPTSRKKLDLSKTVASAVKKQIDSFKHKRSKKHLMARRLLSSAIASQTSPFVGYKLSQKLKSKSSMEELEYDRKTRKDTLPDDTATSVQNFFQSGGYSRDLPDKRGAVIKKGEAESRKVLDISLYGLYQQYTIENGKNISFSKFKKLKPASVLPFTANKYRECLCEYCANIDLKLKTLNSLLLPEKRIRDRYELNRITICKTDDNGASKSIGCNNRACNDCGIHLFQAYIESSLLPEVCKEQEITYEEWTMNNGRMLKVTKKTTCREFEGIIQTALIPFSKHLLNAKWQWEQYKSISTEVPADTVVLCLDFAENYTCRPQDAPQGCHWTNTQCTLHPVVASYKCSEPDCGDVVTDSIVFISEDNGHDYHAVQHFVEGAIAILKEEVNFRRVIQFSDGAPSQYKNKVYFADCSFSEQDFNILSERHFFGSRHGKGPCDREIGVIKNQ